jgi:hypothetical protein
VNVEAVREFTAEAPLDALFAVHETE